MRIPTEPRSITIIRSEADVGPAIAKLLRYDILGFDTETYHSIDPREYGTNPYDGARMRLSQWSTPDGDVFVFDHFYVSNTYLYRMFPNDYTLVGQNLKFDLRFLMYELGIYEFGSLVDTMLASQLINKGNVTGQDFISSSLGDIAKRELGLTLDKDEQGSEWWRRDLSTKQLEYSAKDALIVLAIWMYQRRKLARMGQIMTAEIEFGCLPAIAAQENNGIMLHQDRWLRNCDSNHERMLALQDQLWYEFGTKQTLFSGVATINLNSPDQMIPAFKAKGLPVPINPKTGKESLNAKLLNPYINQYPLLKVWDEYKEVSKGLSSFGPNWLDKCNPYDRRIHAGVKQIGAETGRMSGHDPNILQIPKDDGYRNCFVAEDGWAIIGIDYSQMELRILAEYCLDPNLLYAYDNNLDLHLYTAGLIFGEVLAKAKRGIAKNLNFGIVYGIGVQKFATDANIPFEEAKAIMDMYLRKTYPHMKRWLDTQARNILADRGQMQARTMSGRIREYKFRFLDNGQMADGAEAQIQRNAKNFPIQGTSADITKYACGLFYRRSAPYRKVMKQVNTVHDELIVEARLDHVQRASDMLAGAMLDAERAFLKRVPCVVDTSVTTCWTKEATPEQKAEIEGLLAGVVQV